MFARKVRLISSLAIMAVLLVSLVAVPASATPATDTDRVIVTLKAGASEASAVARLSRAGAKHLKTLRIADAAVFEVTPAERAAVAGDAAVLRVESDVRYRVTAKPVKNSEVLPWGVNRIDAELTWPTTAGSGVTVAVVDTGIDTGHPDLVGNIVGGFSAVDYTTSYKDDHGHGTHVAGTVAATDNLFGVIGVAPTASLLGVKVLDSSGSGWVSDIIDGVDWAVANGADVINMSLGGPDPVTAFQDAIARANDAGVVVVAAAGNSGPALNTVGYPAAYDGVIAVSAVDSYDRIASFSSRGPQVDLAAPGVTIRSTYWNLRRGSVYVDLSGTSMASPHVAGAAALLLSRPVGAWDADSDGIWDPTEVEDRLEATATDLGVAGADALYGAGLVNAMAAITP